MPDRPDTPDRQVQQAEDDEGDGKGGGEDKVFTHDWGSFVGVGFIVEPLKYLCLKIF